MKRYRISFGPRARRQLIELQAYIAAQASERIAENYVGALMRRCHALEFFPNRGTPRDDLEPGLRTLSFKRRATIVYGVDEDSADVVIAAVFYGGQDVEGRMRRRD